MSDKLENQNQVESSSTSVSSGGDESLIDPTNFSEEIQDVLEGLPNGPNSQNYHPADEVANKMFALPKMPSCIGPQSELAGKN